MKRESILYLLFLLCAVLSVTHCERVRVILYSNVTELPLDMVPVEAAVSCQLLLRLQTEMIGVSIDRTA